ncbi:MAG TPA: endonuclease MutS2 [Candidatus Limosilactobacillus merdipullorum]|uniref:Endonuclease MutS2 n=1 Tax=Candidatus Limosilactobacillus merdipullorum TaxID=2838653 RepID=A0A9D1QPK0_9LACO|nr:endonuclease MutS2 [Candidatus Limosilactobacillus merdipullorum]
MNDKILSTLEFSQVIKQLLPYLVTAEGKKEALSLKPVADSDEVQARLVETTDGADLLRLQRELPLPKLVDITEPLKRLQVKARLNGTELAQITQVLRTATATKNFFSDLKEAGIELRSLPAQVDRLVTIPTITKRLIQSIDPDGRINDEASSRLHGIRQLMVKTEDEIHAQMNSYTHGKKAKYLSNPTVTMRNDRYVLPVQSRYRNQFGGVVHDQSASGQTLYIEPGDVVDANNRLKQAQIEERQEMIRVLAELSRLIAPYRHDIQNNSVILGHLDFVNAKAKLAQHQQASLPLVDQHNRINLRQARHPLIDPQNVVANDIQLGADYSAIVITGPNTGGKTITIKTLGIIQLMGQAGLFIPANEDSTIGVFDNIFADIGDEQSLEQNLSTFSGHMDNVKEILGQVTDRSLVLLDELGAGTDPKEGAALAMAILDKLATIGAEVVITTHYPELKVYGFNRAKTINASMEFNNATLQPTYKLLLGIPGQSNGIQIAQRLGIADDVIAEARSFISDESQDLNEMIGDLVDQRRQARERNEELQARLAKQHHDQQELDEKLDLFNKTRVKLLNNARRDANHQVANAKREANKIIHHLRQLEARGGQQVKENELIDAQGKLNALHRDDPRLKDNKVLRRAKKRHDLHVGDQVLVKSYGQQGTLVAKRGNYKWEVAIGILKMEIDDRQLEKLSAKELSAQREKQRQQTRKRAVHTTQTRHTTARLDLRGKRYEQAMNELAAFIDHALLNNLSPVTIIHGKGTGALRKGTQQYLASNPRVKSFNYADPNAGGDGATIVYF